MTSDDVSGLGPHRLAAPQGECGHERGRILPSLDKSEEVFPGEGENLRHEIGANLRTVDAAEGVMGMRPDAGQMLQELVRNCDRRHRR